MERDSTLGSLEAAWFGCALIALPLFVAALIAFGGVVGLLVS